MKNSHLSDLFGKPSRGERSLIVACVVFAVATALASFTSTTACGAHAPANLSPTGTRAWYGTQIIKGLDLLRDVAVDANAQQPPLLSEASTRRIVQYHAAALDTIRNATTANWAGMVETGLTQAMNSLPAPDRDLLAPYVTMIHDLLKTVQR